MPNAWIEKVKSVQKRDGCSYKQAMTTASREKRGGKKGDKSKTHPGDLDYSTKKGDYMYHEDDHNVKKKSKPYTKGTVHIIN